MKSFKGSMQVVSAAATVDFMEETVRSELELQLERENGGERGRGVYHQD